MTRSADGKLRPPTVRSPTGALKSNLSHLGASRLWALPIFSPVFAQGAPECHGGQKMSLEEEEEGIAVCWSMRAVVKMTAGGVVL